MALSHALAIEVLETAPQYVNEFKLAFGSVNISIEQRTQAIAKQQKNAFDPWVMFQSMVVVG